QTSFFADGDRFAGRWPRSGMTRNGHACRRRRSAHRSRDSDSTPWPRPLASEAKRCTFSIQALRNAPGRKSRRWRGREYLTEATARSYGGYPTPEFVEWLMGFPVGWTDCEASAMPSCPRSPSGSDGGSSNPNDDGVATCRSG